MLTNFRISGVRQDTIGGETHTSPLGTWPGWMAGSINKRMTTSLRYQAYRGLYTSQVWDNTRAAIYAGRTSALLVWSNRIWYPNANPRAAHYLVVTGVSDNYLGNGPAWQVWDPDSGGVYHHLSTRDWAYVSLGRLAILPRM